DSWVYLGNWASNGDVVEAHRACPFCTWTVTQLPINITPAGDRITAIAFERHKNPGPTQGHRYLYIGHGSVLTIVDLDSGSQSTLNLSSVVPPLTVASILSIAVHPVYGDLFVEVKDSSTHRFLLNIDEHDLSARHVRDVQTDLHLKPPIPLLFSD